MENKTDGTMKKISFLKPDVVLFICQISIIFIVVCVCLLNLSLQLGSQNFWRLVLMSVLGYIMPTPNFKLSKGSETVNDLNSIVNE